jgi:hypothetical protein
MANDNTSQDSVETLLKKILVAVSEGGNGGNVFTTLQTDILNFGGSTSSFPSLRYSGTDIKARLADNSDFCKIQGKLQTHNEAVLMIPSGLTYLTMYDSNGAEFLVEASQVE